MASAFAPRCATCFPHSGPQPFSRGARTTLVVTAAASTAPPVADGGAGERRVGLSLSRRQCLAAAAAAGLYLAPLGSSSAPAVAAILEADDDVELLEKVKEDRKKRIERQGIISSSDKETGYLQELVNRLNKVGQAIENNDLSAASSVLGSSSNSDWIKNSSAAFTKLSFSPEESIEVDAFKSSLASLISSVGKKDVESSKLAFVSSASALEKWVGLTGLVGQLKGL